MMDGQLPTYVRRDEHGVLRIGDTRVMLDSVLAAWEQGDSPEAICSQYPALSLEQVYGSITWCLSHPEEVAAYKRQQDAAWDRWKAWAEAQPSPVRDRIRALAS
jgi:uncharacterized protein (DUF433 family)